MEKIVLSLGKLFAAVVLCMAAVSCQSSSTSSSSESSESSESSSSSESSVSFKIQDGDNQKGYVITGEPDQLLEISNALLDYLKSAHINNADDAKQFEETMGDVKELLKAASDTINARMETMTLKEKSALIDQVSNINDKIDEKNPIMEREIDRLEKEAKEKGITVGADL